MAAGYSVFAYTDAEQQVAVYTGLAGPHVAVYAGLAGPNVAVYAGLAGPKVASMGDMVIHCDSFSRPLG